MPVLLLQPEDSPRVGPWSRKRWDLIVDLGKSSLFSAETWVRRSGYPVLRPDPFRDGDRESPKFRHPAFGAQLVNCEVGSRAKTQAGMDE